MLNCRDEVWVGRERGIIVGKRYGHTLDMYVGRCYDVRVQRETYTEIIKDVPENQLKKYEPIEQDYMEILTVPPKGLVPKLVK